MQNSEGPNVLKFSNKEPNAFYYMGAIAAQQKGVSHDEFKASLPDDEHKKDYTDAAEAVYNSEAPINCDI